MFDFEKGIIKFIRGGRYPFCNSVLVDDTTRLVIDASSDQRKLQEFKDQGRVDLLMNSHAHEDHLIFNYLFTDSKFCTHFLDAQQFQDINSLIDSYGDLSKEDKEKWRRFLQEECNYSPRKVDIFLKNGMLLDLGKTQMEVVHTPGHTRGHCSFYFPRERVLFTADLDFTKAGPYYGDRTSDIDETIQSLERLKGYPADVYLTSHGKGVFEDTPGVIDRYLNIIFEREEKVVQFLKTGPKTMDQIVDLGIIYGKKSISTGPWDLTITEGFMIAKHLERLIRRGKAKRRENLYILLI